MPEKNPVEFNPSPDVEREAGSPDPVDRLYSQFSEAREFRRSHDKDWPRYHSVYISRNRNENRAEWQSDANVPVTFSAIQTIVPILTDSKPQWVVTARQPEYENVSWVLGNILEHIWENNRMDILLPKVMLNTMIFGNGFMKVLWNQTKDTHGDVEIISVDPMNVFVSPWARNIEEADYVIHAENLPWRLVRRTYKGHLVQPEGPKEPDLTVARETSSGGGTIPPTSNVIPSTDGTQAFRMSRISAGPDFSDLSDDDLVTVLERWERQDDGSVTQTVAVNDKIFFERPSPYGNIIPLVQFVNYPATWSFWAMGEVQQIEQLQDAINRRRSQIHDILAYTANPLLVYDPALVDQNTIDNLVARPGMKLAVEGGPSAIQWLHPPSIPGALFSSNEQDKADLDLVVGRVDIQSGRTPPGVEAASALQILQDAANVRVRQKARFMESSLSELGRMAVRIIQRYYNTFRMIRLAGNDTIQMERPVTPDQKLMAGFVGVNKPRIEDGRLIIENQIPPLEEAYFDVRIGAGSTLPVSRGLRFQQVLALFHEALVDDVEVMKHSDIPRWDDTLKRARIYWQKRQQGQLVDEQEAPASEFSEESAMEALAGEPPDLADVGESEEGSPDEDLGGSRMSEDEF